VSRSSKKRIVSLIAGLLGKRHKIHWGALLFQRVDWNVRSLLFVVIGIVVPVLAGKQLQSAGWA
jgi:hypothetical protein